MEYKKNKLSVYPNINIICGVGTAIAAGISYFINHSIIWAILHGVLGWIYTTYQILTYCKSMNYI